MADSDATTATQEHKVIVRLRAVMNRQREIRQEMTAKSAAVDALFAVPLISFADIFKAQMAGERILLELDVLYRESMLLVLEGAHLIGDAHRAGISMPEGITRI